MTRLAYISDIKSIIPLLMEYRTFYGIKEQNIEEVEQFLHNRITNNESIIFITFDDETPVGFIQLYPSFSTVSLKRQWHLNDLYVRPEYRRKGYASALMSAAKKYFYDRAKGFTLITEKKQIQPLKLSIMLMVGKQMNMIFTHSFIKINMRISCFGYPLNIEIICC